MRRRIATASLIGLCLAAAMAPRVSAADPRIKTSIRDRDLPETKRTPARLYLTAREAAAALARHPDVVLVDIRDPADVTASGLPHPASRNIPLFVRRIQNPGTVEAIEVQEGNTDFVTALERLAASRRGDHQTTILLICWQGTYSAHAAALLGAAGFASVYTIVDGTNGDPQHPGDKRFPGWRAAGLPWQSPPLASQLHEVRP